MLLTITYEGPNATDLGYLLHKNPDRPQTFDLAYGKAHVFYPEASETRCIAALLLDIDPVELAKTRKGGGGAGGLFDYVNDRPYVASSFMSSAIMRVFSSAISGKCNERPELTEQKLSLTAGLAMLPARGDKEIVRSLFEPLGYDVQTDGFPLDSRFPEWGDSPYYSITLKANVKLSELLQHLCVLIPAIDAQKHYWVGEDEIDKLIKLGNGWLARHPKAEQITMRYLKRRRRLVNMAIERLMEDQADETVDEPEEENPPSEKKLSLNSQRMDAVLEALKNANARRVIDLGCGDGNLLTRLVKDRFFEHIAGSDVSHRSLEKAHDKLKMDWMSDMQKERIVLFQGSLTYRDKRFSGYDGAAVVEVIEHLDQGRLASFEKVVFKHASPPVVVVTTPNREYNAKYENLLDNEFRHKDHRFEWTRAEFEAWASRVAAEHRYNLSFSAIGDIDSELGSPTQMGIFKK
jgi:3' terminal RNA ribose 2'-O-methyltransferase Hen1